MGERYLPFIDGLRALAVIAVVLHHFEASLLPSGYLGVDIFFVISGFVITNSLLAQRPESAKDLLVSFYRRRIKRLLPALLVCVAVTGIAICLFNPYPRRHLVTGLSSLIGASNLELYQQATNYWGDTARLNPFTHTWSLGVEEQFYLLFPALFWALVAKRGRSGEGLRSLLLACAVICAISLAGFVALHYRYPQAVFYLPVFRFWQLGMGCVVALAIAARTMGQFERLAALPSLVPLGGIVLLLFTPIDGGVWAAVGVTALTGLTIAQNASRTDATALLTHGPALYIGRISYSLYLWHWPVIVLSLWTIGLHWWSWPIQMALIACLAVASYHCIERPLRYAAWSARPASLRAVAVLVALSLPVLALGLLSGRKSEAPSLFLGTSVKEAAMLSDGIACGKGGVGQRTIRTVGNSHSLHILPMLERIGKACGWRIVHSPDSDYIDYPRGKGIDAGLADAALASLRAGDILILSSRYHLLYQRPYLDARGEVWQGPNTALQRDQRRNALDAWLRELDDLLARAVARGVHVVQFLPNVEFDAFNAALPPELCTEQWFRNLNTACRTSVARAFLSERFPERWFAELAKRDHARPNFHVFDPMPVYCQSEATCPRIVRQIDAFRDTNHLSVAGALLMVQPFMTFLAQHGLVEARSHGAAPSAQPKP